MSVKMRRPDGQIVYRGIYINCKRHRIDRGKDDIIERIRCISRTVMPKCSTCSLVNRAAPQSGLDTCRLQQLPSLGRQGKQDVQK